MRIVYVDCKLCKGTGEFLNGTCKNCRGQGQIAVKVDEKEGEENKCLNGLEIELKA